MTEVGEVGRKGEGEWGNEAGALGADHDVAEEHGRDEWDMAPPQGVEEAAVRAVGGDG